MIVLPNLRSLNFLLRTDHDLRITLTQSDDSLSKSRVTNSPNFSHGVMPTNCKIGADAAMALKKATQVAVIDYLR